MLLVLLLTAISWGGEATASSPQALLLPGSPLVAGEPGTVELWLPGLTGQDKVRARARQAHVGRVKRLPDGRLLVPFSPAPGTAGALPLTLHLPDNSEQVVAVPVRRPMEGGLAVVPGTDEVHMGDGQPVTMRIRPLGTSPQPLAGRRLVVRATTGQVEPATTTQDGWSVRWTPPAELAVSAWAVITVADAAAPGAVVGWAAVALSIDTPQSFTAAPGASCQLQAGPHHLGPATADAKGVVAFTVPLHPAVAMGSLTCVLGTNTTTQQVALPAGTAPGLAWLPLPGRVPAGATLPVQAIVLEPDGIPRSAGTVPRLTASTGTGDTLDFVGPGLVRGTWTAPRQPGAVTLRLDLPGAEVSTTVQVVADLPAIQASGDLAAGSRDGKLVVAGAAPQAIDVVGGSLRNRRDAGRAGTTATIHLARGIDVASATVAPTLATSDRWPSAILAWADTPTVPAGSRTPIGVTLVAIDDLGLPVPGVDIELNADHGTTSPSAQTDGQGIARVRLTPAADGVAVLRAEALGLEGDAPVLVGLARGPLSTAPGSGSARQRALRERLRAALPTVVIASPGAAAGQAATPAASTPLPVPTAASARTALDAAGPTLDRVALAAGHKPRARAAPREPTLSWGNLTGSIATVDHAYRATSTGLHGLPKKVRADQGNLFAGRVAGAPALDARAVLTRAAWPLSADLRLAGRFEGYVVNQDAFTRIDLQGAAGVRVPFARASDWQPYFLGQAEYFRVPIFSFDSFRSDAPDKATGARMRTTGILGARLGVGAELRRNRLAAQGEASETLAPWPVNTRAQLSGTYDISKVFSLRLGAEFSFRTMTFDLTADKAHVFDQQHALSAGIVYRLR